MTSSILGEWAEKVKTLASRWTAYTAFGSFVLYLLGYLALRFHLTALGIGTDMSVVDERYLFTGARFLVYTASAIPIAVMLALIVAPILYGIYRAVPRPARARLLGWLVRMVRVPQKAAMTGIVLSLILIQLVMRQCFFVSNVLLGPERPTAPAWLVNLLAKPHLMPLFFSGMLAGTAIPLAAIVVATRAPVQDGDDGKSFWSRGLLMVLVAIQLLLLPVNYGILIVDKSLARVVAIADKPLPSDQQAWLVWEGKDGITYLVRRNDGARSLVTVPKQESKRIEITSYDSWLSVLLPAAQRRKVDDR